MSVLIHDGRRTGHMGWCEQLVASGAARGVFISAFSTPRVGIPRNPSAEVVAKAVHGAGGEVIFSADTHARLLAGSNRLDHYDTWEFWPGAAAGLDSAASRLQHIERVFERQTRLGTPLLAPTQIVDSPDSAAGRNAIETAEIAAGIDSSAGQTIAGTRAFWRSGYRLDEYIGRLAALRSPLWVVTMANDFVADQTPDLADVEAFVGMLRSIHSLSNRSRVIVAHADFAGLLAVAAGADTIGSGWDRSMRTFDPSGYHLSSDDGPRIPASYVTQGGLSAVLRRDAAVAIDRWNPALATTIRGGAMPLSERAEKEHHLRSISQIASAMASTTSRLDRVAALREHYEQASLHFDTLIGALRTIVKPADKEAWVGQQARVLEAYASAEGLW